MPPDIERFRPVRRQRSNPFQKAAGILGKAVFQPVHNDALERGKLSAGIARHGVSTADHRPCRIFGPAKHVIGAGEPFPARGIARLVGQPCRKALDHALDHRGAVLVGHLGSGGHGLGIGAARSCYGIKVDAAGLCRIGNIVGQKRHPWRVGR